MNNRVLDISRFEYHDNVAVDNCQDMWEKEIIVYFDYYNYVGLTGIETVANPIKLVIKGWSKILYYEDTIEERTIDKTAKDFVRRWSQSQFGQEQYDKEMKVVFNDLGEKNIQIYEILNMDQCDNYVFLHIEGELDNKEFIGFLKFNNATVSLEEIDMSKRTNSFLNIDEIDCLNKKDTYVVTIPTVANRDELLNSLKKQLIVPDYISFTWDNLEELLSNIYWLGRMYYVIIHENLSDMSKEDLNAYIKVIKKCQYRTLRTFFILDRCTYDNYYKQ